MVTKKSESANVSIDVLRLVAGCSAAVQIVEWIELERENLVRQLHLLRSV